VSSKDPFKLGSKMLDLPQKDVGFTTSDDIYGYV
jgi:hypothetical protein